MRKFVLRKVLLSSKISHEKVVNYLKKREYETQRELSNYLRSYCEEVLTKDILQSLFIVLHNDEYRFPTLERSIQRGRKFYWIHEEFVQTEEGLVPKWYLNSKVKCS